MNTLSFKLYQFLGQFCFYSGSLPTCRMNVTHYICPLWCCGMDGFFTGLHIPLIVHFSKDVCFLQIRVLYDVFLASPGPLTLLLKIKKTSELPKWLKQGGGDRFIPHKKTIKAYLSQQKERQKTATGRSGQLQKKERGVRRAALLFSTTTQTCLCALSPPIQFRGKKDRGIRHTVQTQTPQSLLLSVSGFPGSTQVEECSSGSCCIFSGLINRLRPCWIHILSFKSPTVETDGVMVQCFTAIFHLVCQFCTVHHLGQKLSENPLVQQQRVLSPPLFFFTGGCHNRI